ncbi:MAG: isoprenylcysteine carboxylmethyltransferase family protein [Phenylobacterium sp.]
MSRPMALFLTLVFNLIVPGTFAVYLPYLLTHWRLEPPLLGLEGVRWLGGAMIVAGVAVVLEAQGRFVWNGLGTPAPIAPPQKLVVQGFYRFVRNPMYVAVVALTLGQGLLFASPAMLAYAAILLVGFHLFVRLYEEPTLGKKFPADYPEFVANVPRWLPRLSPWKG